MLPQTVWSVMAMQDMLFEYYNWLRALHIISVIAWMAGMLYLPRLFIYHVDAPKGSTQSETFKIMERRLLRIITNPAMISSWVFGALLLLANPSLLEMPWMHAKLLFVVLLSGVHGLFSRWRKQFERDENTRPAKFYRIWNEVPTLLMIGIVIFAVAEPF
jgi:putative membrane protein